MPGFLGNAQELGSVVPAGEHASKSDGGFGFFVFFNSQFTEATSMKLYVLFDRDSFFPLVRKR
jgi:hypothetical protein